MSTPLNPNYQISALNSLRYGIEEYDKRKGWRGPIANIFFDKNWKEILEKINLDKTLGWKVAQVLNVSGYTSEIKFIKDEKKAQIFFENLKWTNKKSLCVVLCAKGYPDSIQKNTEIPNLSNILLDTFIFKGKKS